MQQKIYLGGSMYIGTVLSVVKSDYGSYMTVTFTELSTGEKKEVSTSWKRISFEPYFDEIVDGYHFYDLTIAGEKLRERGWQKDGDHGTTWKKGDEHLYLEPNNGFDDEDGVSACLLTSSYGEEYQIAE